MELQMRDAGDDQHREVHFKDMDLDFIHPWQS